MNKLKHYQRWEPPYINASCYYMYGLELWPHPELSWGYIMPVVYCHRYEYYGLNN